MPPSELYKSKLALYGWHSQPPGDRALGFILRGYHNIMIALLYVPYVPYFMCTRVYFTNVPMQTPIVWG